MGFDKIIQAIVYLTIMLMCVSGTAIVIYSDFVMWQYYKRKEREGNQC